MKADFRRLVYVITAMAVDTVLLQLSYVISFFIRYLGHPPTYNLNAYTENMWFLTFLGPLTLYCCGLYGIKKRAWAADAERIIKAIMLFSLLVMASTFMVRAFSFPRTVFALSIPFQLVFVLVWRRYVWLHLSVPIKNRLVAVGTLIEVKEVLKKSSNSEMDGYGIEACILTDEEILHSYKGELDQSIPVIGTFNDTNWINKLKMYDGVILCSSIDPVVKHKTTLDLVDADKVVLVVPSLYEVLISSSSLTTFCDLPLISVHDSEAIDARISVKRLIDVTLSLIALILSSPIMAFLALLIKLTSPGGPVLLRQARVGYGNKTFTLYKFRTMIPDAEKYSGPVFASERDPRITPFGHFLRATRLDELPQFFNILRGDMSIVGPRPERPYFVAQFMTEIPEYSLRHKVPVGLTGLAQIMGNYDTEMKNKLRYDLAYVGSWTIANDFIIMLKTAGVMVTKGKAR